VLQGTIGVDGVYTTNVIATITASDQWSGVASIVYRLNGGVWKTYTGAIIRTTTLEFYAKDSAGNVGAVQSKIVKIDRTVPTSSAYLSGTLVSGYYRSSVSATLTATDAVSGVSSILYRLNGGVWTTYTGPITISTDGKTTLEFYARDYAGNQGAVHSRTINIDLP